MVIQHHFMDLPLGNREDVLDLRLSRNTDAIHSKWIVFPLQLDALREYTSSTMVFEVLQVVLSPNELFLKVALPGQAILEPIAEIEWVNNWLPGRNHLILFLRNDVRPIPNEMG